MTDPGLPVKATTDYRDLEAASALVKGLFFKAACDLEVASKGRAVGGFDSPRAVETVEGLTS